MRAKSGEPNAAFESHSINNVRAKFCGVQRQRILGGFAREVKRRKRELIGARKNGSAKRRSSKLSHDGRVFRRCAVESADC